MVTAPQPHKKKPRAGRNLPAAIIVGVLLVAVAAVGLLYLPWLFVVLVTGLLVLGVKEVSDALLRKGMHAEVLPIMIGTAISVAGGYLTSRYELGMAAPTFIVICLSAMLMASTTARLRGGPEGFLRDVAASALLIAYIPMLGVFVPLLLGSADGSYRIITVVSCVVIADVGAYGTGVLFGKHKMAPTISPSKTWEGFAGSLFFTALVGAVFTALLLGGPWWVGVILGLACAAAATLGDLVESLFKRDAGLKDMSNFLPGHGGVMDRLDSLLMAVPVGWFVLYLAFGM